MNCYMLDNFARSYKRLAAPYSLDGKPSRGARQRPPAHTFRPTSCSIHLVSVPAVLTFPNSPDCRSDIGCPSPVLVGGNQDPYLIFTDKCRESWFQANIVDTVNGIELTEAGVPPNILSTRPNTLQFHFIASFDVPRTRKQGAARLWPFKHRIRYDAATAKADGVHRPR